MMLDASLSPRRFPSDFELRLPRVRASCHRLPILDVSPPASGRHVPVEALTNNARVLI
jgi:hypothetical protein